MTIFGVSRCKMFHIFFFENSFTFYIFMPKNVHFPEISRNETRREIDTRNEKFKIVENPGNSRVETRREINTIGKLSFRMSGDLGKMSYGMLKLSELGDVSLGILMLGELE